MNPKTLELRKKRALIIVPVLKKLFPTTRSALNYTNPLEFLFFYIPSKTVVTKNCGFCFERVIMALLCFHGHFVDVFYIYQSLH